MEEPIRTRDNFLVFGSPLIEQDEIEEVLACMRSSWLGTGPRAAQFESDFAAYKGTESAIAVNSCTAALHLSLLAMDLKPGDEVITSPLTFCATVNSIIHAGGTPVLADINRQTLNIDPQKVREAITPRTRAIIPVHFAGRMCEMNSLLEIAREHNLAIIEDCAHAIESEYEGKKAGTIGDFGCFSFYSTKNVVTGEGGMILAKNTDNLSRMKTLALHGMSKDAWKRFSDEGFKHYQVVECGYKYNMMDLQAAIGIHQLARVERMWAARQKIWNIYQSQLQDLPFDLPAEPSANTKHAHHLFTIQVNKNKHTIERDTLLNSLTKQGIGVGVHYLSLPEHPYYQEKYNWKPEAFPNAMLVGRSILSIPISAKLAESDISDVIKALKRAIN